MNHSTTPQQQVVLRDWMDKLITALAANHGDTSILLAEARALREQVKLAAQARFSNIVIEGENLTLVQALQGSILVPWQIFSII